MVSPSATLTLSERARPRDRAEARRREEGDEILDLGGSGLDFSVAPHIVDAMKAALDRGNTQYTAIAGMPALREAIAEGASSTSGIAYTASDVIVSCGAKQAIFNAILCLIEEGDEAIVASPCWLSFPDIVRFAGGKAVLVPTEESRNFVMSAPELEGAITDRTRVLILNSPANPTGAVLTADDLGALAEVLDHHPEITVISDEMFDRFVYGGAAFSSILHVAPRLKERVLIIQGCSKTHALAGLRIGWGVGPRPLIAAMGKIQSQSTSCASSIAQYGALAAVTGDQEHVKAMAEALDIRRRFAVGRLRAIPGLTFLEPRGAFYVFPDLSSYLGRTLPDDTVIENAFNISAHLLHNHGLVVVPGGPFGAPAHVRLSFAANMDTLSRGIDRLRTALTQLA